MILVQSIYTVVSICGLFSFGKGIQDSILVNVGMKYKDDIYWESYLMQVVFLIILACHIPYLYFSGKESLLVIVDEIMRRSTSFALSKKLQHNWDIGDALSEKPELPEEQMSPKFEVKIAPSEEDQSLSSGYPKASIVK